MDRISRYEIQGELGHGGFGTVYRAYDPMMRRKVAIKVLSAVGDPAMMARFRSEAGTTGNLHHNNIITVYDYGEHSGQPYFVMELLEGRTLENSIREGPPLPLLEKIRVLTRIAEGLQYAHHNGVVHRDVKPANVILLEGGGVKILDFGISRFMDQARTRHTAPGHIVGTIEYMAPDQIEKGDADALTDIFSFGVMSYELLTGTQPFRAAQVTTVVYRLMNVSPAPLCQLAPDCPQALERIVHTAMAKDRSVRYQSLQDLLFDLAPIEAHLRKSRAAELAFEVGRSIDAGDLDAAQSELRRLLDLDPTLEEGQDLRHEIQRRRDHQALLRHVHELVALAEEYLIREAFEAATATLESALQSLDPQSELALRADLESRLSATRQLRDVAGRFAALLAQAKEAARQGDLRAACQWASAAAVLDPSSEEAIALRQQFAQEAHWQSAEAERVRRGRLRRDEVVSRVTQRAHEHIEAGRLSEAAQLVAGALKRYPNDPDLNCLQEEVAEAHRKRQVQLDADRRHAAEPAAEGETRTSQERVPARELGAEVASTNAGIEAPPDRSPGSILRAVTQSRRRTIVAGTALLAVIAVGVAFVARWRGSGRGQVVTAPIGHGSATTAPYLKRPPTENTERRDAPQDVNSISSPTPATPSPALPPPIPPPNNVKRNVAPTPQPPKVVQFTAEPVSIQRGQSSVLKWAVTGDVTSASVNQEIGAVPIRNAGGRRVFPADSAVYTLTAAGPGGTTAASVTVSVIVPPPAVPPVHSNYDLQAREREAILQTLVAYSQAVQNKDQPALRALWPTIPANLLERWRADFENARSVTLEIRPKSVPQPDGDVVRVECDTTTKRVYEGSQVYSTEAVTRITLRKLAGTWKIETMR